MRYRELLDEYKERLAYETKLLQEMHRIPKGYLETKKISGKEYLYLQYTDQGKKKSEYIHAEDHERIKTAIARRKPAKEEHILDSLLRIAGAFSGDEYYVLKQINSCIAQIPPSSTKEYADKCAMQLSREAYMKCKQDPRSELELGTDYDEYIERIKQLDTFFKCYLMMRETGV